MLRSDAKSYQIPPDLWPDPSDKSLGLLALHTIVLGHVVDELAKLLLILSNIHGPLSKLVKLRLPAIMDSISQPPLVE